MVNVVLIICMICQDMFMMMRLCQSDDDDDDDVRLRKFKCFLYLEV